MTPKNGQKWSKSAKKSLKLRLADIKNGFAAIKPPQERSKSQQNPEKWPKIAMLGPFWTIFWTPKVPVPPRYKQPPKYKQPLADF